MRRDRLVTAHLPWWHSCDLVPGSGTDSCSVRPGADLSVGWLAALTKHAPKVGNCRVPAFFDRHLQRLLREKGRGRKLNGDRKSTILTSSNYTVNRMADSA